MTAIAVAMPVQVEHLVLPGTVVRRAAARVGESVKRFLQRNRWTFDLDTILTINGKPVLRAAAGWKLRRIAPGDVVRFISRPFGGNGAGKQIAGLVALIALTVFASWAVGPTGALLATTTPWVAAAAKAGIVAAGMLIFNTLVMPKPGNRSDEDSLYSFNASGNVARPLETIPDPYGNLRRDLNYAALPYKTFSGNDEFFHGLFMIGCGRHAHEELLIEDIPFWSAEAAEEDGTGTGPGGTIPGDAPFWANGSGGRPNSPGVLPPFDDVQVEFVEPGQPVTLFPTNVHQSPDVTGIEFDKPSAPGGGWSPWYPVCNPNATTQLIHLDIALPNGFVKNNHATLGYYAVEIAPIDNAGALIGAAHHVDRTISALHRKPHRFTDSFPMEIPARYALRFRRNDEPLSSGGSTDIYAAGLRAELPGSTVFPEGTMVAVRIKATKQMSDYSSRRIRYRGTRILPVWTGSTWEDQPTRNPIWAAIHYRTNEDYGGRLPMARVDLDTFIAAAAEADARGDCFDHEFANSLKVGEGLDVILATCRSKHRWMGDTLSLVRDEWQATPRMVVTDREMTAGSFSLTANFRPANAPDGLIVNYIDRETWRPAQVVIPVGSNPINPRTEELRGVTGRAHATREAVFKWNAEVKRRIAPSFTMMLDGHLLFLGDHVDVQSRTPQGWGEPHAVIGLADNVLRLPRPATRPEETMYAVIRNKMGEPFGPFRVTKGASTRHLVANTDDLATILSGTGKTLADALDRAADAAAPTLVMGKAFDFLRRCQIVSCEPRGDKAQIAGFIDYEEVHDPGEVEEAPRPDVPPFPSKEFPKILSLDARLEQVLFETRLVASWPGAPTASRYVVEVLYEESDRWLPVYDGHLTSCDVVVDNFAMQVRVVPFGDRGAGYASPIRYLINVSVAVPPGSVGWTAYDAAQQALFQRVATGQQEIITALDAVGGAVAAIQAVLQQADMAQVQKAERIQAITQDAIASVTQFSLVQTAMGRAFAALGIDVTAAVADNNAGSFLRMIAEANEAGVLAAIRLAVAATRGGAATEAAIELSTDGVRTLISFIAEFLTIRDRQGNLIVQWDTENGAMNLFNTVLYASIIRDKPGPDWRREDTPKHTIFRDANKVERIFLGIR